MIDSLINTKYKSIDAYAGIDLFRNEIILNGSAVVLVDNKPIGVITPSDLLLRKHSLVIDCLSEKPKISLGSSISDAMEMMEDAGTEALPVYDDDTFLGTLFKGDIIKHLMETLKLSHSNLQEVAHDLRSPIANLMGIIKLLEAGSGDADSEKMLDLAKKAYDNANQLINEILAPGIPDLVNHPQQTFKIGTMLEACVDEIRHKALVKGIDIDISLPGSNILSYGNPLSISRAINNILTNAVKFTKVGGIVKIDSEIHGGFCTVRITDNGIGIPQDMIMHIFEKFTRAKRIGTDGETTNGIGLYIAKKICDNYSIDLQVSSIESEGTEFSLKFKITGAK